MTYFDLFEMPVLLQIDNILLKKKFYELSRKWHPDFYTQATEEDKEKALEKSALLNKAFKNLVIKTTL